MRVFSLLSIIGLAAADHFTNFGETALADFNEAKSHAVVRALAAEACSHFKTTTGADCKNLNRAGFLIQSVRYLNSLAESTDVRKLVGHLPWSDEKKNEIMRKLNAKIFEKKVAAVEEMLPPDFKPLAEEALRGEGYRILQRVLHTSINIIRNEGFRKTACEGIETGKRHLKAIFEKHTASNGDFVYENEVVNRHLDAYCEHGHNGVDFHGIARDAIHYSRMLTATVPEVCAQGAMYFNQAANDATNNLIADFARNYGDNIVNALC